MIFSFVIFLMHDHYAIYNKTIKYFFPEGMPSYFGLFSMCLC